jgi:hypothetical protein
MSCGSRDSANYWIPRRSGILFLGSPPDTSMSSERESAMSLADLHELPTETLDEADVLALSFISFWGDCG